MKALDHTFCWIRFGRGYGPIARQTPPPPPHYDHHHDHHHHHHHHTARVWLLLYTLAMPDAYSRFLYAADIVNFGNP